MGIWREWSEKNKDMHGGGQEKEKSWRETQAVLTTSPEPSLTSQPHDASKDSKAACPSPQRKMD